MPWCWACNCWLVIPKPPCTGRLPWPATGFIGAEFRAWDGSLGRCWLAHWHWGWLWPRSSSDRPPNWYSYPIAGPACRGPALSRCRCRPNGWPPCCGPISSAIRRTARTGAGRWAFSSSSAPTSAWCPCSWRGRPCASGGTAKSVFLPCSPSLGWCSPWANTRPFSRFFTRFRGLACSASRRAFCCGLLWGPLCCAASVSTKCCAVSGTGPPTAGCWPPSSAWPASACCGLARSRSLATVQNQRATSTTCAAMACGSSARWSSARGCSADGRVELRRGLRLWSFLPSCTALARILTAPSIQPRTLRLRQRPARFWPTTRRLRRRGSLVWSPSGIRRLTGTEDGPMTWRPIGVITRPCGCIRGDCTEWPTPCRGGARCTCIATGNSPAAIRPLPPWPAWNTRCAPAATGTLTCSVCPRPCPAPIWWASSTSPRVRRPG